MSGSAQAASEGGRWAQGENLVHLLLYEPRGMDSQHAGPGESSEGSLQVHGDSGRHRDLNVVRCAPLQATLWFRVPYVEAAFLRRRFDGSAEYNLGIVLAVEGTLVGTWVRAECYFRF